MRLESALGFAIGWSNARRSQETDRVATATRQPSSDPYANVPMRSLCEADFLLGDGTDVIAPPARDWSDYKCWLVGLILLTIWAFSESTGFGVAVCVIFAVSAIGGTVVKIRDYLSEDLH